MSETVELSEQLVAEARKTAELAQCSPAEQIEAWARLGRILAPVLSLDPSNHEPRLLSEAMATVDTDEGRQRVKTYLESRAFPHFEAVPGSSDLIIRIDQDGTRTTGRFENRQFIAVTE